MSVQVSYKKQTVFFIILAIILFVIVEMMAQIYEYSYPSCMFFESEVFDDMSFELKRDLCLDNNKVVWNNDPLYLLPNQHHATVNINQDGFRGEELLKKFDYRIVMIGGSTVFGTGTTDDTTIPAFLEKKTI